MLPGLYLLQQVIVYKFFWASDDKNVIIGAQMVKVLFILQILDSTKALLH